MKTPAFLTCAILLLASCMPLQAGTRITPSPAPSSSKVVIVTDSHKNDKKYKKHKKVKKDKKEKTVVIKVGTKVKKRPDFVNAYPKNHQRIEVRYVDAVS